MDQNIDLTASELSQLWGAYMNASLMSKVLAYFHAKVEDKEIEPLIQDALTLEHSHLKQLTSIFEKENKPIPVGFTDKDVDVDAPRLYSDNYFLQYIFQLGSLGIYAFAASVTVATREDVYLFFSTGLSEYNALHQKASLLSLTKGVYTRPPYIPTPNEVDFVKKQSFLAGWFGEQRPLLATEITHLFSNMQRNNLGIATLTGYSQVAKSKDVKEYILRGIGIAQKQVKAFSSILEKSKVPTPMGSDSMVTASNTISPFSDKLIMYHVTGMIGIGIGFYGLSISTTIRRDIAAKYTRLTGEIALYSEDGANLMIENEWLEEPPRMVDRDELAKPKK
ncbi:hypothetical protein CFK37_02825 [Virgibacillus phasianinus]|uniref:Uncharacterized protein n=1 Tax=Virgibacillus phasianinus TaxID=2017483 RepID=A0A220TZJ8_9BACI|nr:DUF3231 family protein [Virgibacillus phasianinus]ASK61200.1 hypothetical protein CFK37_02825 [Virgibacillus phasianinus]